MIRFRQGDLVAVVTRSWLLGEMLVSSSPISSQVQSQACCSEVDSSLRGGIPRTDLCILPRTGWRRSGQMTWVPISSCFGSR